MFFTSSLSALLKLLFMFNVYDNITHTRRFLMIHTNEGLSLSNYPEVDHYVIVINVIVY